MSYEGDKSGNSLGIPRAIFLEDVDKFMKDDGKSAEDVLRKLEELFQKYRVMEVGLLQKKEKLKVQIPDIKLSLGYFNLHIDKKLHIFYSKYYILWKINCF